MTLNAGKVLVKEILKHPDDREWTLQGFGMLRTYLSPEVRLHVWDSRYAVDDVSTIHTHPWDMESEVLAGSLVNQRYMELGRDSTDEFISWTPFHRQTIVCGEGGGPRGTPIMTSLFAIHSQTVPDRWGQSKYSQKYDEIHESRPEDGTVTLVNRRVPNGGNPDLAYVYWPEGKEWVSAEPRKATPEEVLDICDRSLERWF